ncbi:hypothetical protein ABZW47_31120 [Streptomyces sp. NPDC004549]|uniref:hypothetical protein n=1 Tax=Streptomyces sp. NPDC004549 TaxID=3154283 RepID=UPI0033BCAA84
MSPCGCDYGISIGPAMLAVDFIYRHEHGRRNKAANPHLLVMKIACLLKGDAPVCFDFAAQAEELGKSEEELRAQVVWLVEREFLALDGDVDGVARLWVNPALAFAPGTDPRAAAARYRFPYVRLAEKGMAAAEPVVVYPYEPELWEQVYEAQREMFEDPPVFRWCEQHAL